ncbi:MAG: CGNR zinc finger domain-containing protein [Anaerolineae bacterium]|nr:CGNR zinc finger domain-containing protein [Anaerolineae bacterium]
MAFELRAAIFAVLSSAASQQPPPAAALATLNEALAEVQGHLRLTADEAGARWTWVYSPTDLAQMLGPVVWSAVEVLQSADRADLRVCEGHDCDWVFLDTSRNHSRRWCSMQSCGNRAKARRHYHRGRATPE